MILRYRVVYSGGRLSCQVMVEGRWAFNLCVNSWTPKAEWSAVALGRQKSQLCEPFYYYNCGGRQHQTKKSRAELGALDRHLLCQLPTERLVDTRSQMVKKFLLNGKKGNAVRRKLKSCISGSVVLK